MLHNLPARLTSFVGRQRELAEIRDLFTSTRLLTLVGSGGAGKTRLAVEYAAGSLGDAPDGAWLVELGPVSDGSLVVPAVADVFELREQPGVPLLDSVVAHLADRHLLVLLDNCEHVLEASAEVADRLLGACPEIRILATSREPVRVPGEVVLRVPPLAVPDPKLAEEPSTLASFDAVRLFEERARAAAPRFDLRDNARDVALLCSRLDGLPLAIELAASRIGSFPVSTIVERLNDRFALLVGGSRTAATRQQTLHAALDWSYDLLDERERALLRRLSVFVGGISVEAAEGVCADGRDPPILAVLGQLIDKSLAVLDDSGAEPRYRLLETVRAYGLERLEEADEREQVERRHAEWFGSFAAAVVPALPRPDRGRWLSALEAEHDNIRTALERSLIADPEVALQLAGVMWHFWLWRAYLAEGRRWLDEALTRVPGRGEHHAAALLGSGVLTMRSGAPSEGIALAEEALAIYRELGDVRAACWTLQAIAVPEFGRDDMAHAEGRYRESLELAAAGGFEPGRAAALQGLGLIRWHRGAREEGEGLLSESLALFRSLAHVTDDHAPPLLDLGEFVVPDPGTGALRLVFQETFSSFQSVPCATGVGYVLANLGMIARADGRLDRARARLEEALAVFEEVGDERAIGHVLGRLGNLATAEGDHRRARELLERSLEIRGRIGDGRGATLAQANLGNLAAGQGDLVEARRLLEAAAETFRRRGDRWGYAGSLGNLASVALAEGDRAAARSLLEKSLLTIEQIGITRWKGWALVQLGALARLEGDEERAGANVRDALEIFRRIDEVRGVEHAEAFLARSMRRGLATVLFGDIVGSTATASDLGNEAWSALVDRFLASVRETLAGYEGEEIDTAGDGFLAVFDGPSAAIACAAAIQRRIHGLGLSMRAGVHTGEIERVGTSVRGLAVHIGARASALAGPGEIVVTQTVRDLLLGTDIRFEALGTHVLKGVPGEWTLHAVIDAPAATSDP